MIILRKIVFVVFLFVYLVVCPFLIAYSLGYTYKPGNEQGLVKTGLIYLATTPARATIYLEGKRFAQKTPAIIRNLVPGTYEVKVMLKNHQTWRELVPVEAEKATAIGKVLLLPQVLKTKKLAEGPFQNLIPIRKNNFFFLTNKNTSQNTDLIVGNLYLYQWKEGRGFSVFSNNSPVWGQRILSYTVIDDSPSILLNVLSETGERYLKADLKNHKPQVVDLTNLFMEKPEKIKWDREEKDYLFTFQEGHLNRLDVTSYAVNPKFIDGIRGFGLFDREIYTLNQTGNLVRFDENGKVKELPLRTSAAIQNLPENQHFDIEVPSKDIILMFGKEETFFVNYPPYKITQQKIVGFDYNSQNEKVLFWTKNKIGILLFPEKSSETKPLQAVESKWLVTEGKNITQAFWVYQDSYVLFVDNNDVYLLETRKKENAMPRSLFNILKDSHAFYAEDSGEFYYLDAKNGSLCSVEILPKREIPFLTLPEIKEGKKKIQVYEI